MIYSIRLVSAGGFPLSLSPELGLVLGEEGFFGVPGFESFFSSRHALSPGVVWVYLSAVIPERLDLSLSRCDDSVFVSSSYSVFVEISGNVPCHRGCLVSVHGRYGLM